MWRKQRWPHGGWPWKDASVKLRGLRVICFREAMAYCSSEVIVLLLYLMSAQGQLFMQGAIINKQRKWPDNKPGHCQDYYPRRDPVMRAAVEPEAR